ncbi:MAG: A/G-specific adenine glycosylase, partial [Lachnospiraceae bacterium]|nr:A/G-specific adenine glycosylase [Lachnospiraceae bacterium]
MKYDNIAEGRFLERPNRFIAKVMLNGIEETVHVKNTGRCRELLVKDAAVYLVKSDNPSRSTNYDLVAVKKGERLINMDSQAPNRAVEEWLRAGGLFPNVKLVRPETIYGNSRFDFYIETEVDRIYMEVKGVTLEENGVVLFPDAPSERAVKHVEELAAAKKTGCRAIVMFIIQMEGVKYFTPNEKTHAQFAEALRSAAEKGVEILAYDCIVTSDSMEINRPVSVVLNDCGKNKGNVKKIFRKGELKSIPKLLLKWYDTNKRILPWREAPTSYRVWVSEIMLQQTRVEAVRPYFERFMNALPDMRSLAEAEEELLLKLWEGLGYYNRVRNLQKAAVRILEEYGGKMPDSREELQKLPGIGSYTAGAIASIAFQRPVPAVDGNVLRVLARFRRDERFISDTDVKKAVERDLEEIMPAERPGDFNQAMMEIGACVCIPNGMPLCGECPLADHCMAHAAGEESEYPRKQAKKPRRIEEKTVLIVMDENRAAIRKRAEKGLLAGMYEFPSLEGFHTAEEVAGYLSDQGLKILRIQPVEDAKHIFTHREWHMKGYMVRVDELEPKPRKGSMEDWLYIEPWEVRDRYPIPSAFEAYRKYLSAPEQELNGKVAKAHERNFHECTF